MKGSPGLGGMHHHQVPPHVAKAEEEDEIPCECEEQLEKYPPLW